MAPISIDRAVENLISDIFGHNRRIVSVNAPIVGTPVERNLPTLGAGGQRWYIAPPHAGSRGYPTASTAWTGDSVAVILADRRPPLSEQRRVLMLIALANRPRSEHAVYTDERSAAWRTASNAARSEACRDRGAVRYTVVEGTDADGKPQRRPVHAGRAARRVNGSRPVARL